MKKVKFCLKICVTFLPRVELFHMQVYQETTGVEHIPVVQIDLTVPLKVPGEGQ